MTTPTKEDLEKAREIVLRDYKLKTEWTEEQLKGRVSGELAELLIASFAQALSTVREEQKEKDARIAEKHKHKMKWQKVYERVMCPYCCELVEDYSEHYNSECMGGFG